MALCLLRPCTSPLRMEYNLQLPVPRIEGRKCSPTDRYCPEPMCVLQGIECNSWNHLRWHCSTLTDTHNGKCLLTQDPTWNLQGSWCKSQGDHGWAADQAQACPCMTRSRIPRIAYLSSFCGPTTWSCTPVHTHMACAVASAGRCPLAKSSKAGIADKTMPKLRPWCWSKC